jgi:hypothetical protein
MKVVDKLLYRRYSKEDYKELRAILGEETRVMLRRPQYIIGHILILGLVCYFLVRAFVPARFQWPETRTIVMLVVGAGVGVFVAYLMHILLKVQKGMKFAPIFWGIWILLFFLLTEGAEGETRWEYVMYFVVAFVGWMCCTASIKEHFCEKIFMSRKEKS